MPRKCIDTSAYIALIYKLKNPSAVPQTEDTTTYRVANNDGTFSRLTLSNNGRHTIITPFIGRCFHKTVESAAEAAFKAIVDPFSRLFQNSDSHENRLHNIIFGETRLTPFHSEIPCRRKPSAYRILNHRPNLLKRFALRYTTGKRRYFCPVSCFGCFTLVNYGLYVIHTSHYNILSV